MTNSQAMGGACTFPQTLENRSKRHFAMEVAKENLTTQSNKATQNALQKKQVIEDEKKTIEVKMAEYQKDKYKMQMEEQKRKQKRQ